MRYRVAWELSGYRIIDTTDGGVVYGDLSGVRAVELLCSTMNSYDILSGVLAGLLPEQGGDSDEAAKHGS